MRDTVDLLCTLDGITQRRLGAAWGPGRRLHRKLQRCIHQSRHLAIRNMFSCLNSSAGGVLCTGEPLVGEFLEGVGETDKRGNAFDKPEGKVGGLHCMVEIVELI